MVLAAATLLAPLGAASAQEEGRGGSLFERLNLDRLQLTALGGSIGAVSPTQTEPTQAYSVHADYGEIVPKWRVVFTGTYWGSQYKDEVIRTFTDSLRRVIIDPSGDDTLRVGEIDVSDIAIGVDLRWFPRNDPVLRPYIGGGLMTHVINAEGPAINGTFVERALDYITFGLAATAGVDLTLLRHFSVGMQGRFDMLSGVRFASLRATGTYHFDAVRRREDR